VPSDDAAADEEARSWWLRKERKRTQGTPAMLIEFFFNAASANASSAQYVAIGLPVPHNRKKTTNQAKD
jgi:hypothetical protein